MTSHKSSPKQTRAIQMPQRANGRLRVAAILEAAADVIAEKGYEAATMAEIAARSGTKIGSLYRFFPNKESVADTLVVSARENLDTVFDRFDAQLVEEIFRKPALMKLLDASQDWSVKREEFKRAALRRIGQSLLIHSPGLPKKSAEDIALVVLLNTKTMAK